MKQILLAIVLANFNILVSFAQSPKEEHLLDKAHFQHAIAQNDIQLVDVRTSEEFQQGSIDGAQNIDFLQKDFLDNISNLDKDKAVYIFCKSGKRSANAREKLLENGFTKVYELDGGFLQWQAK
ncbi:rhodanese-like domain-containing protein [Myroides sp. LJL116]